MPKSGAALSRYRFPFALAFLTAAALAPVLAARQATAECREPQACRELALDARARGAFEAVPDLAWRAVQTGKPNDPDLMYLLARAQALSGRRRDAAITLRRLADAGIGTDAGADQDFRSVRELSDWQLVVAITNRLKPGARVLTSPVEGVPPGSAPAASAATVTTPSANPASAAVPAPNPAAPSAAPAAAAAAATAVPRVDRLPINEAARFSTSPFTPGGLAYDAVSKRFLFGDRTGRRLFVVGDGSDRSVDLARAESAGFDDVTAIAIDPKRGHQWVATSEADGNAGNVHHLQLISGRALAKLPVPGRARVTDMAVAADGRVFILDSATPRVLVLRPGATTLDVAMPLAIKEPASLAVDDEGQVGYVANREGITRIDFQARRATALNAAKGVTLAGFEFVRLHRDTLIGTQLLTDGTRNLMRLRMNGDRRTVTQATVIETPAAMQEGVTPATISNGDLYYVVSDGTDPQTNSMNVRVSRIKLP